MKRKFIYKGKDYYVDDEGNIHEDSFFGSSNIGKMDKNGNFTIKTGFLTEETGRISSWSGDVYETGFLGVDKGKVGEEKNCFLTTACVEYAGLSDDCRELQMMRKFRDEYIRFLPDGDTLIRDYYQIAPLIVEHIKSESDASTTFKNLLKIIRSVVTLVEKDCNSEALALCKKEFQRLKKKYKS